jgi:hypothetical protein
MNGFLIRALINILKRECKSQCNAYRGLETIMGFRDYYDIFFFYQRLYFTGLKDIFLRAANKIVLIGQNFTMIIIDYLFFS